MGQINKWVQLKPQLISPFPVAYEEVRGSGDTAAGMQKEEELHERKSALSLGLRQVNGNLHSQSAMFILHVFVYMCYVLDSITGVLSSHWGLER